jgi:hypothetical protein
MGRASSVGLCAAAKPSLGSGAIEWLSQYLRNHGRPGFGSIGERHTICALILPSEMPLHQEIVPGCCFPALVRPFIS